MKCCVKCKIEKSLTEFYCNTKSRDGKGSYCKKCVYEYGQLRPRDKEKIRLQRKAHYEKNREQILSRYRRDYQKDVEKHRERRRAYVKKHPGCYNIYFKQRAAIDPLFKLKKLIRKVVSNSLFNRGYNKKSKTHSIIGCDFEYLQSYLIKTALKNYGEYVLSTTYHIDHIIPLSTGKTEEDVLKLNHYTNLQLLKPEDNIKKSNKVGWRIGDL